jgi:hemoglobin
MADIQTYQDVQLLVSSFYDKVQKDELIGPIFNEKIKDWQPHLDTMYKFWSTILFEKVNLEQKYTGHPFIKHAYLPVSIEHFERWLTLFYQNADALFKGAVVDEAKKRAAYMANMFYVKIEALRGNDVIPIQ